MINQEVVQIARERMALEISEQNAQIQQEIGQVKAEMAARGMFQSGRTLRLVTDICINGIKARGQISWQTYFRFLTTAGMAYSETLADEIKAAVFEYLPERLEDLNEQVNEIARLIGMPDKATGLLEELVNTRAATLTKVGTEIDLFVISLRNQAQAENAGEAGTVVNIYSPVGSVQTGNYTTANVVQQLDAEVRLALSDALDKVAAALVESDNSPSQPTSELIELIEDGRSELQKDSPNVTKLRSLLSTVGSSVQTLASARPAYEALKQALTFLGVSLP